jgi:hypothetical protein
LCGRKLLLTWDDFGCEALIRGDESVVHTGGRGGVSFTSVTASSL